MKRILLASALSFGILLSVEAVPRIDLPAADFTGELTEKVSLAGKKGNVRRHPPGGRSTCGKGYKKYIAASGHSAYAQTPARTNSEVGYICGWSLNQSTTARAEAAALRGCRQGLGRFKVKKSGDCRIYASK